MMLLKFGASPSSAFDEMGVDAIKKVFIHITHTTRYTPLVMCQ